MRQNLNKMSLLYAAVGYCQEPVEKKVLWLSAISSHPGPEPLHGETASQRQPADQGSLMDREKQSDEPAEVGGTEPQRVLRAEELFGDQREVWIELDGVRYRLRITRRGKLILQK
jgi:hemin uptake protein HemP